MEEDIASKRAKLDDCQLEASDGHRGEGREVVSSGSHGTNTQTRDKGSFSPHVCIHTGTHTVAEYPTCNVPRFIYTFILQHTVIQARVHVS